ncbi:MAG: NAD(P)H-dependent glycerol-3-phosphate dehydrogenase [Halioglobus sp.]
MPGCHRVAVLGGGSFGTVIANIIAANGHPTRLWMRNSQGAELINTTHENPEYLPGYKLHTNLSATTDLEQSIEKVDILFVAVPSKSFREVVQQLAHQLNEQVLVISLTKGIESPGFHLMSEILRDELLGNPIGVLSGPNLAKEIAQGHLTGSVIATATPAHNDIIQRLLHSNTFRVYSSHDMYGVELGGALKNVYAIMSGLGGALGLGDNTMGMLMTRALAEMSRFAVHMGANPMTFLGLAGVGDLIVTCASPLSRNYRVGYALGEGQSLDQILEELGQVAEGINTLGLLKSEADRRNVYMPLVNGLYAILYDRRTVSDVIGEMMLAEQTQDVEFVIS